MTSNLDGFKLTKTMFMLHSVIITNSVHIARLETIPGRVGGSSTNKNTKGLISDNSYIAKEW